MKICQLCAVDFTLHHFLLPLMRAIRAEGHEVVGVCADGPLLAKARAEGFRIEAVGFVRGYDPRDHARALGELVRLFRRERFDLVHVHTPVAALIGRVAARLAAVPRIVYTAHGFYFHERMSAPRRAAFQALEWFSGRFTDLLFTQAEEDAATARRLRLSRGPVHAIGNGADPARWHPPGADGARERLRGELGAGAGDVVIAMVGRLVAEKGYPELFAAMREVPARLWVIGERLSSDHAPAIDQALAALNADRDLASRVRLLGYRADVPDLLRAADIFTLPSHREGMPRSILEAMLTGLPVVATDIRGSREEVVAGETGLLVPVGDRAALAAALRLLVADGGLRARMGAAGLARARDLHDESRVIARQIAWLGLARAN
jgi:glycosyltransferase involved in cell wall biosynthesis